MFLFPRAISGIRWKQLSNGDETTFCLAMAAIYFKYDCHSKAGKISFPTTNKMQINIFFIYL